MTRRIVALMAVGVALLASSCSNTCPQVRTEYETQLKEESTFLADVPSADAPVHFGILLRTELLNQLVANALEANLNKALQVTDDLKLPSGQTIGIKTEGQVADLGVYADKSCENCVRLAGRLDGKVAIKLPIIPIQRVPLRGTFSLVAPILFGPTTADGTEIQLDMAKAAQLGHSSLDADVSQLPPTWAKVVRAPLAKTLLNAVSKELGEVKVATVKTPDLGIKGFVSGPATLKTNVNAGLLYLGFTSNLPVEAGLVPKLELPKSKNFQVSVHPAMVTPLIQAALNSGKISRTYTEGGKANQNGPMHVTVNSFGMSQTETAKNFDMHLRLWNLQESGQCYWADAVTKGSLEVEGDKVSAKIVDAKITESSLPGIALIVANWKTSDVVESGKLALEKSLSKDLLSLPGSSSKLEKAGLMVEDGQLDFSGKMTVTK